MKASVWQMINITIAQNKSLSLYGHLTPAINDHVSKVKNTNYTISL